VEKLIHYKGDITPQNDHSTTEGPVQFFPLHKYAYAKVSDNTTRDGDACWEWNRQNLL